MSQLSDVSGKADIKSTRETFPVLEMTCAACAISVESMLRSAPGVKHAAVNFASQSVFVEYDASVIKPGELQNVVRSIGYDLIVEVENRETKKEEAQLQKYQTLKR